MTEDRRPILVLGSSGRQGGAVAKALADDGWPLRALLRDTGSAAATALRDAGVAVMPGSLDDTDALRAAMGDAHGVFSVMPAGLPDGEEVRFGTTVADAAVTAGIEHLVYSSGASVGEELTGIPRFDAKPLLEAHVRTLPIAWTIVRPMIFMEMVLSPGLGLEEGRFTFFVRSDQTMQLVAVDDIGRLVVAVFADHDRFTGATLTLASDTVTGDDIATALSTAAGRPIPYARFTDAMLASKPDFAEMTRSIDAGPLAHHADISLMRQLDPELLTLSAWLAGPGRDPLRRILG